jgi:hypothetical protein
MRLNPISGHSMSLLGDFKGVAEHVRNRWNSGDGSDIDLLRDLNCIIDLHAEIPDRALDL